MMVGMKNDFYVEDEPLEDVQRAWKSGEPVLVITSDLRIRVRQAISKAKDMLDDGRRAAARIIEPPEKKPSGRVARPKRRSLAERRRLEALRTRKISR
jgi:hypothetical protein